MSDNSSIKVFYLLEIRTVLASNAHINARINQISNNSTIVALLDKKRNFMDDINQKLSALNTRSYYYSE